MIADIRQSPVRFLPHALTVAALAASAAAAWQVSRGVNQLLAAGILMALLAELALLRPRVAIGIVFVYLAVLGDLRRLIVSEAGRAALDPLLLIGPGVVLLLAGGAYNKGRLNIHSRLTKMLLALMAVMVLQILNPLQGGIMVGIGGGLFYLVPLLWFWVGQAHADASLARTILLRIVIPVAFFGALLGIYQSFFGLLPFEQKWAALVSETGYTALNIGKRIRPFSFFTSAAEYGHYIAVSLVVLGAAAMAWRRPLYLLPVPVLLAAIFLGSSRGIFASSLFAVLLMWALLGRTAAACVRRLVLSLACGAGLLAFALTSAQNVEVPQEIAPLVNHQVNGLLNPLDEKQSTATIHFEMVTYCFKHVLVNPIGSGLGSTTLAANTLGGSGGSSEIDFSNLLFSLGLGGGVLYLVIIYRVLATAVVTWRQRRTFVSLATVGILVVELGQWLLGGHYSVVAVIWFCIGAMDREGSTSAATRPPLRAASPRASAWRPPTPARVQPGGAV